MKEIKQVALIGFGRWGEKVLIELLDIGCTVTVFLRKRDAKREVYIKALYPEILISHDLNEIKINQDITHVCIITPPETHHNLASFFLGAGKYVFVEKPIAMNYAHAKELLDRALSGPGFLFAGQT